MSSHSLLVEKNKDLLIKKCENQPIESTLFSEVNEVYAHHARCGKGRIHGRGYGCDPDDYVINFVPFLIIHRTKGTIIRKKKIMRNVK